MSAQGDRRRLDSRTRFPTRLDRWIAATFYVVGLATLIVAVLLTDPGDGLLDGILPSLLLVLFVWPQIYVMWRLYGQRRRQEIAERHEGS